MSLPPFLEFTAQYIADVWYRIIPRRRPSRQALNDCKIVSHRGEHDNLRVKENTMAAFERAAEAGAWGIEFDVRWTRDLQPVVIHDEVTKRVFDFDLIIAEVDLDELRLRIPGIPTLVEVVSYFGGKLHLMVELKADFLDSAKIKAERLQPIFASLTTAVDYHFLALQFELFELVEFAGDRACLPVAELNLKAFSRTALERDLAGVSGQYLLLNQAMLRRHQHCGQKVGTGFIASRFCFYREMNRGVDWIFTNHAVKLSAIRKQLLR